jgi:hypothetical protein
MATTLNKTMEFGSCIKDPISGISKHYADHGVSVVSESKQVKNI